MSDFIRNLFSDEFNWLNETAEKNARLARQEGKKEGIEEGIIKGKREGVKEYQSETVRNLLDMDLPHDKIAKATGLQLSEVEALAAAR